MLSQPVKAWNKPIALQTVVPSLLAMLLSVTRRIFFPAWSEIQMFAAELTLIVCWKFARSITTTSVSPVWTSTHEEYCKAWSTWTTNRVSASSWLHWPIGGPFPAWRTSSPRNDNARHNVFLWNFYYNDFIICNRIIYTLKCNNSLSILFT